MYECHPIDSPRTDDRSGLRRHRLHPAASLLLAAALAACGSEGGAPSDLDLPTQEGPASAEDIHIVSGNRQVGPIDTSLPDPLVIRVTRGGQNLANEDMRWEMVDAHGGSVEAINARTGPDGVSRARVTLGSEVGEYRVLVRTERGTPAWFNLTAEDPPGPAAVVTLDTGDATLEVGDTLRVGATAHDADGDEVVGSPTWNSSAPSVATVDGQGLVTAVAAGTSTIGARFDDAWGTFELTVRDPSSQGESGVPGTVTDLSVASVTTTSVTLRWTQVDDGTGSGARYLLRSGSPTLDWSAAAPGSVYLPGGTVGEPREYTFSDLEPGTRHEFRVVAYRRAAFWLVEYGELSDVVVATTATSRPTVASVDISPAGATLDVGETRSLTASVRDTNGNVMQATPTWSSSSASVASVDAQGLLRAVGPGTATVRAQVDGVMDQIQVTVREPTGDGGGSGSGTPGTVRDLSVVRTTSTSVTLRWTDVDDGTGRPANYSIRSDSPSLTWWTAAETAKYLSGQQVGSTMEYTWTGLSTGDRHEFRLVSYRRLSDGSNQYGGLSNTVAATTSGAAGSEPAVARVTASTSSVSLTSLGATAQLSASAFTAAGAPVQATLVWSSLRPDIAQVSSGGRVSAVAQGTTGVVVAAACCDAADTVAVTVTQQASGLVISPASLSLTEGQTASLTARVLDTDGFPIAGSVVSWSVSNQAVASVSGSGVVRANSSGVTQVSATAGVLRTSITVRVEAAGPSEPEPPVDNGGNGAAFVENWDFSSTADLFSQPRSRFQFPIWANQGGELTLATGLSGTPWGGTKAVRTHWGGGPYANSGDEQIGVDVLLPSAAQSTEVWVEVYLRYSSNFRVLSDHKTMFVFEEDGSRWEMRFGAHRVRAQAKLDNGDVEIATDASGRELDITNPNIVWDGQWHVLRLHLRTGSSGVFRTWLDGNQLIDSRVSNGSSRFNRIALGRNGDPAVASDLYWGPVRVYTQNPGW